ncbi:hypothetical protein [Fulvivirga aurantia]|uniref:hypothetical protein n=1 Tax=Fulvivirga aurantia TaxID=2529383 RepID=UPI0012BD1FB9|nr:hypothetical protein [Fulvivirga aurantia]
MNNRSTVIKEWLSIALGVMAALAILCSQSFTYTQLSEVDKSIETEIPTNDSDDENQELATISQVAVSSFVQVTLSQGLHFITNIYHNVIEVVADHVDQKIDFNSYFKALFRLIISPNAP